MISAAPTRLADISAVLDNPSAITAREIERAGFTQWTALKFLRDCLKDGEARTVFFDGEIAFILGIAPHPLMPRHSSLWFIATEAYWRAGAQGVRFGRSFLRSMEQRFPSEHLTARSFSDHPDTERWFALLGFRLATYEGLSRVFVRPASVKAKADMLSTI